jgi:hypothetical protein
MVAASDVEGVMRKLILLIAAAGLILCSLDVWAGNGSRTDTPENAAVFIISNAL